MSFKQYNEKIKHEVRAELTKFFTDFNKEVKNNFPKVHNLTELFGTKPLDGKMVRATLVCLGYELAGKAKNQDIIKAAASFEILQASFLVHDDIMDQSPLRHGKPALYVELGNNHYGISQTISLGDMGIFLANKLLATTSFTDKQKIEAIHAFNDSGALTAVGQLMDMHMPQEKQVTEKDILLVTKTKSGHYSISYPLLIGSLFNNGQKKLSKLFEDFGSSLGIAYQLRDDILSIFGNQQMVGKSLTTDIAEGKQTIIYLYALSHATKEQKKLLNSFYGNKQVTTRQVDNVKEIFIQTGAKEYAEKRAKEYAEVAKKIIPKITTNKDQQLLLYELADYLVNREK